MFKLITDSTADLPMEYLEAHDVGCLPISYILDGVTYGREKQLDWKEFYACMREEGKMPTTSQYNPAEAKEQLKEYITEESAGKEGSAEILYLAFSSGLSGTCSNLRMAARELMEEYPDICIITDTKFTESDAFFLQFDAMLADARELGLTYLFDRIVIQVYSGNMRTALNNIYPFPHYIYTLYQDETPFTGTKEDLEKKAAYCAERGIGGITMSSAWWNPAFPGIAKKYGIQLYLYTVNDAAQARQYLDAGCSGVYSDSLTPSDLS